MSPLEFVRVATNLEEHMRGIRFSFGFIFIALLIAGCRTAFMSVPAELAATEAFAVTGANPRLWNRPLSFGPWRTSEVREGGRWGFAAPLLGLEAGFSQQPYRLVLEHEDGRAVQAECVARSVTLSRSGWSVDPTLGALPALACGFRSDDGDEWTLKLHARGTNFEGELSSSSGSPLKIRSVHRLEGSRLPSGEPVGYEIAGDSPLAAVETVNRGRVWLAPSAGSSIDRRTAAAAAVLLLFEPADE